MIEPLFLQLQRRWFYPGEFYPSAGHKFLLLSHKINVLQQGPGAVAPSHLIASLLCLLFHHKAFFLVEYQVIEGNCNLLDGRLSRIYQNSPCVSADDQTFGAPFVWVNKL